MPKYPDKIWTSSSETPQNGPILDIYNRLQSVTRQYTEKAENLDFPRFSAFFLSERAGIRTPDNLIKSHSPKSHKQRKKQIFLDKIWTFFFLQSCKVQIFSVLAMSFLCQNLTRKFLFLYVIFNSGLIFGIHILCYFLLIFKVHFPEGEIVTEK